MSPRPIAFAVIALVAVVLCVFPARAEKAGNGELQDAAGSRPRSVLFYLVDTCRDGSTPLSSAAFLGRVEALKFLLEKGADPDVKNAAGDTALEATRVPWELTAYIAGLLRIEVIRDEVEAGRKKCAEILQALN